MAINGIGYSGSVDEAQHAKLMAEAGNSTHSVANYIDFFVRRDLSVDRGIYVDPGAAMSYGLYVESTAIERLAATPVTAGIRRYDTVVIENDFNPPDGSAGTSKLKILVGGPTAAVRSLTVNPGVLTQQPLFIIGVEVGSSAITELIDLRCWQQKYVAAASVLGLPPPRLGAHGRVGSQFYQVDAVPGSPPAWRPTPAPSSILGAVPGTFAPLAPTNDPNQRVWGGGGPGVGHAEVLAEIRVPDYGRPVRADVRFTAEMGSTAQSTRWDLYAQFDSYTGEVIGMDEGGPWINNNGIRFFNFHPLISNAFSGARTIQFLAKPGFGPAAGPALGIRTNYNTYAAAIIHAA